MWSSSTRRRATRIRSTSERQAARGPSTPIRRRHEPTRSAARLCDGESAPRTRRVRFTFHTRVSRGHRRRALNPKNQRWCCCVDDRTPSRVDRASRQTRTIIGAPTTRAPADRVRRVSLSANERRTRSPPSFTGNNSLSTLAHPFRTAQTFSPSNAQLCSNDRCAHAQHHACPSFSRNTTTGQKTRSDW